jgi:hypothetical protein
VNKIKLRATLYSLALILLLITIFLVTIIKDKKHVLEEKTSAHRALLRNSFDLAMLDTQKGLVNSPVKLPAIVRSSMLLPHRIEKNFINSHFRYLMMQKHAAMSI